MLEKKLIDKRYQSETGTLSPHCTTMRDESTFVRSTLQDNGTKTTRYT